MSCFGSTPLHHPLSKYLLADQYVNQIYILCMYLCIMYVIEILVYSFGFSKKTQREEEIYSRDFYSSFYFPTSLWVPIYNSIFRKNKKSNLSVYVHTLPQKQKNVHQKWVKYCHSLLDNTPKGVLFKKECSVHFFEHVNSL